MTPNARHCHIFNLIQLSENGGDLFVAQVRFAIAGFDLVNRQVCKQYAGGDVGVVGSNGAGNGPVFKHHLAPNPPTPHHCPAGAAPDGLLLVPGFGSFG